MEYLLIYLAFCSIVGLIGRRRRLGFWGYFFFSILTTPVVGLVLVFASDPVAPKVREHRRDKRQVAAIDLAFEQLLKGYDQRISILVETRRITPDYANRVLKPLLTELRQTSRPGASVPSLDSIEPIMRALEQLPPRASSNPRN